MRARRHSLLLLAPILLWAAPVLAAQAPTEVFVLATLYHRHAATPAYSHDSLRQIVRRIDPQVLVLDVSPEELRSETVAPSKAEYPEVIFPWLRANPLPVYPGEPDEPAFTQIVSQLGADLQRFRAEDPERAQVDKAFNDAAYAALAQLWTSPAAVNSAVTDQVLHARRVYQDQVTGAGVANAWRRWNAHALQVVHRALAEHPGKRLLVLLGVENCGPLRNALRADPRVRLVDMEEWLRGSLR